MVQYIWDSLGQSWEWFFCKNQFRFQVFGGFLGLKNPKKLFLQSTDARSIIIYEVNCTNAEEYQTYQATTDKEYSYYLQYFSIFSTAAFLYKYEDFHNYHSSQQPAVTVIVSLKDNI